MTATTGFVKLPKVLFEEELLGYRLSVEACVLYAMSADRTRLSQKNGKKWQSGSETFVYFTVRECMTLLQIGHDKAGGIFKELEQAGLIKRKK